MKVRVKEEWDVDCHRIVYKVQKKILGLFWSTAQTHFYAPPAIQHANYLKNPVITEIK